MRKIDDWYYIVRLAQARELAHASRPKVEDLLVELICEKHLNARFREFDCEASACEVAVETINCLYGGQLAAIVGYKKATRYAGGPLTKLGEATFTAPCGCRAWRLPFWIVNRAEIFDAIAFTV
jgi:hypothetical protein